MEAGDAGVQDGLGFRASDFIRVWGFRVSKGLWFRVCKGLWFMVSEVLVFF